MGKGHRFDLDPDEAMVSPREEPLRHPWIWAVYVLLYGLSIPWYLSAGQRPALWLGLPSWTVVSLLATTAIAVFTVFVIQRYWSDGEDEEAEPGSRGDAR